MSKQNVMEKKKLPDIKNIIIVASGKGGVGKSTVAAGLAYSLAMAILPVVALLSSASQRNRLKALSCPCEKQNKSYGYEGT